MNSKITLSVKFDVIHLVGKTVLMHKETPLYKISDIMLINQQSIKLDR